MNQKFEINPKKYYEKVETEKAMERTDIVSKERTRRRGELILRQIPIGETVVEIGMGKGELAEVLRKKGFDYKGTDISKEKAKKYGGKVEDVTKLSFKNESIDVIICSEVLEHIPEVDTAIMEIQRVLKLGGKAIITVPNKEKLRTDLCIHCNKPTPRSGHLHRFEKKEFTKVLKFEGFEIIKIKEFGSLIHGYDALAKVESHLPFPLWAIWDKLLCKFVRPVYLMVVVKKNKVW